uniref:Uncharacterized protein n=1 Tax=Candidatus Kentrum sp. FM TaxID=2126340 RepID=A0A450TXE9_9GAMM|nr:MAG: hypothetical protein BECKFM1743A_GA0114220_102942 [Candidatus Kentron sp. FM]VFJ73831.1 MAG: hypothetical protein BECKFM1743C_GA0114222_107542 [Candidatus Kentron sp. FM]VFK21020.1 MAG: hypothetical protein BECKFM1743B_GA0114221_107502 [Candidatus Kentron sp. FM]
MTVEQGISLGITIGLGVVPIVLATFAIWLSLKFARDSEKSLTLLQEKATEIRILTEGIFSQQDRHMTKFVDHALRNADKTAAHEKHLNDAVSSSHAPEPIRED